jgi:hypothetical protein
MLYCKWISGLLLLIPCYSFADSSNVNRYPDKIMCIVDKYVTAFPIVTKYSQDVQKNLLWISLLREFEHRPKETAIINSIQVRLIDGFSLRRKKGVTSEWFSLTIWTMGTSTDANKLFNLLNEYAFGSLFIEKPPKRYFVYENFFVLLETPTVGFRYLIVEGVSDIIQTCFECGTIDVGATLRYVGDKEGCGKRLSK